MPLDVTRAARFDVTSDSVVRVAESDVLNQTTARETSIVRSTVKQIYCDSSSLLTSVYNVGPASGPSELISP